MSKKSLLSLDISSAPSMDLGEDEHRAPYTDARRPDVVMNPNGAPNIDESLRRLSPTGATPGAAGGMPQAAQPGRGAAIDKKLSTKDERKGARLAAGAAREYDRATPGVLGASSGGTGMTPADTWRAWFGPKAPPPGVGAQPAMQPQAGAPQPQMAAQPAAPQPAAPAPAPQPQAPGMIPPGQTRSMSPVGLASGAPMVSTRANGGQINSLPGGHAFIPRTGAELTQRNLYVGDETGDRTREMQVAGLPPGKKKMAATAPVKLKPSLKRGVASPTGALPKVYA